MKAKLKCPFIIGCIMVVIGLFALGVLIYERIICKEVAIGEIVNVYTKEYTYYRPTDVNSTRIEKHFVLSIKGIEHDLVEGTFNHFYEGQHITVHYNSKNNDLYWIEGEVDTLISDVLCVVIGVVLMICFRPQKT